MSLTVTSAEAQSKDLPVDADPTTSSTQVVDDFNPTYEPPSQEVSEIDFLQI